MKKTISALSAICLLASALQAFTTESPLSVANAATATCEASAGSSCMPPSYRYSFQIYCDNPATVGYLFTLEVPTRNKQTRTTSGFIRRTDDAGNPGWMTVYVSFDVEVDLSRIGYYTVSELAVTATTPGISAQ